MLPAFGDPLSTLKALAQARRARGDNGLVLNPSSEPEERFEPQDAHEGDPDQGLVLEPFEGAPFEPRMLAPRQGIAQIKAFCDGTRSTYHIGYEDVYPIAYTDNAAVVRLREPNTFYHETMERIQRQRSSLLAPFNLFGSNIRSAYERLGLCSTRLADLCWDGADDDEYGLTPVQMKTMGSLAWQSRALRRARRLLDLSEQIVSLAAARRLRERVSGAVPVAVQRWFAVPIRQNVPKAARSIAQRGGLRENTSSVVLRRGR